MSYDLFFCTSGDPPDPAAVIEWAEGVALFEHGPSGDDGYQLLYHNEETGVYFTLDGAGAERVAGEDGLIPEGFADAGLSFNMNYLRPSFFACEAMSVVEQMGADLGLLAVDPQPGGGASPKELDAAELTRSWIANNDAAVRGLAEGHGASLPRMPREKSLEWWRYMRGHSHLQIELGDNIFVPQLLLLRRKGTDELLTALTWPQSIPEVFPRSDLVAIDKVEKRLLGLVRRKEMGLVGADAVMGLIEQYLQDLDAHVRLRMLPPGRSAEVRQIYRSIEFDWSTDDFEGVAPDGFVDFEG